MAGKLLNTKEAAQLTGLSEYELRMGAKQGRYPVILVGDEDSTIKRLKWNCDALLEALNRQLSSGMTEKAE